MLALLLFAFFTLSFGGNAVIEKTLPNGIKLLVKETEGKGIVSGVVFLRGGLNGERKSGETHLLMTLLLKGSKSFPSSYDVSMPFEQFGGYIYSSSGNDFSEIGFATKEEGFELALRVIRDIMENPLLLEEDMEREKKNTIVAIRSKRERGMDFAMEHLRKLTYGGTPYENSPLGTEENVASISRKDLLRRWKELLKGGNIVVSVVGDVPAGKLVELLEEGFSWIEKGRTPIEEKKVPIKKSEIKEVQREGTQTTILCAFNAPPKDSEDYLTFKVLASALGDGMTSVLFRELREKKGYAYATYAFYPTRFSAPRLFAYIGTSPEKGDNALKDLLSLVKSPPLQEEDIKIAKNKIVGDFLLDHQTRLRQAWYLGFYETVGLGWKMDEELPDRVMGVKLKEVKSAISRYIDEYHCVVVKP